MDGRIDDTKFLGILRKQRASTLRIIDILTSFNRKLAIQNKQYSDKIAQLKCELARKCN